ncbi:MAG TPA: hypothetical protein VFV50_03240, partial [Bdellovibrionales bacterium]|nr:hypothetical protein [Bdellovibrionales bacterium]
IRVAFKPSECSRLPAYGNVLSCQSLDTVISAESMHHHPFSIRGSASLVVTRGLVNGMVSHTVTLGLVRKDTGQAATATVRFTNALGVQEGCRFH